MLKFKQILEYLMVDYLMPKLPIKTAIKINNLTKY